MVLPSVSVLAGLSAILSTGFIGVNAEPHGRPGPGQHHHHADDTETVTFFVTVPVYPETTAQPPVSVSVTDSVSGSATTLSSSSDIEDQFSTSTPVLSSASTEKVPYTQSSSDIVSSSALPTDSDSTTSLESATITLLPSSTFSLILSTPSLVFVSTDSNFTVDLPTSTASGIDITTSLLPPEPTVCPGFDETILETIWTTLFNTVTATAFV